MWSQEFSLGWCKSLGSPFVLVAVLLISFFAAVVVFFCSGAFNSIVVLQSFSTTIHE